MKRIKSQQIINHWSINYFMVVIGAFIVSLSFIFFITPYKIVPGGIYGISIIIHYLTKGVFAFAPQGLPVGLMGILLLLSLMQLHQ